VDYHYRDSYRDYEYKKGYKDGFYDGKPGYRGLRRSQNGVLLGVCQGFADWIGIPAWPLRLATIITFVVSGFWPVGALYLLAAVIMKPERR